MNTQLIIEIIFYLLLIDSILANIIAWGNQEWYVRHFRVFSRYFPITKGWTSAYLILTLYIGYLTLMM